MAESEATIVRNLVREYQQLATASRAAGNRDAAIRDQMLAVAAQLQPYANTFTEAQNAVTDIDQYVRLIDQKLSSPPAESAATDVATSNNGATQNPNTGATLVVPQSDINRVRDIGPAEQSEQITKDGGQTVTGNNNATKTLAETQNVSSTTNKNSPQAGGSAGVGAPNDDSGSVNSTPVSSTADKTTAIATNASSTSRIINAAFNGKITPQPNVLDQYASYTYSVSWYLMAPESYKRILETGKLSTGDFQLLVQSGGAPVGSTGGQSAGPTGLSGPTIVGAARNPYFQYDYYIENLEIKNYLTGKGRGDATNSVQLEMTISEPLGITLIGNLRRAVEEYYTKLGVKTSWMQAEYALIIRFYGYDDQGRLVQVGKDRNSATDNRAVVEKFYPFNLTDMQMKPSGSYSRVEYRIQGAPISHDIALGTGRNVILSDTSVSGRTVRDILVGNTAVVPNDPATDGRDSESSSAPQSGNEPKNTPSKADAAGNVKFSGLVEALNKYQRQLVNNGTYEVADEYEIEFFPKELGDSLVIKDGTTNYNASPIDDIRNASQAVNPEAQSANFASRTATAYAGTVITQFIDQQMRNSQYVTNQSKVYFDEVTGERKVRTPGKQVAWFKINVQATPKTEKVDSKRGGFAYKIKYLITPFNIVSHTSEYFPDPVFRGLHKSYKYWFTGQNTQVLSWDLNYNLLYQAVMSDSQSLAVLKSATNNNDIVKRIYQPTSNQSAQGADLKTNEPSANLADSLYDPNSLVEIKLKIVGDPAWMQQGEVATGISEKSFTFNPFNNDGTINFQAGDVVFDITWARPQDYDLNTGLADPSKNNTATNNSKTQEQENATYYATEVTSTFRAGKFEQLLQGTILLSFSKDTQSLNRSDSEPMSPGIRVGDGVVDAQASSGTASSDFTNTRYSPNLISSEITSLQTQTNDTANGSVSIESPSPQAEPEPADSNGDITPKPTISSEVTAIQNANNGAGSQGGDNTELAGPPKLPSSQDNINWDEVPIYEIRGTADSLKNKPVTDKNPQLMNKEF